MALHEIVCENCGDACRVRIITTKLCYPCRLGREAVAAEVDPTKPAKKGWLSKPTKCWCGDEFWPVRQGHKSCYYCTDRKAGARETECSACHKKNMIAPGLEKACWACTQKSQLNRDTYMQKLGRRYAKIMSDVGKGLRPRPVPVPVEARRKKPKASGDSDEYGKRLLHEYHEREFHPAHVPVSDDAPSIL